MSEWYCRQRRVVVVVKRRADGFVWCPPFGQCRCRLLRLDSARALLPAAGCDPAGKSVLPPVSVSVVRLGSVPTQSQSENSTILRLLAVRRRRYCRVDVFTERWSWWSYAIRQATVLGEPCLPVNDDGGGCCCC